MTEPTRRDAPPAKPAPDASDGPPLLDKEIQGRIGDHLRAMYDGMMQQPVPDRFRDLIARLEGGVEAGSSK